MKTENAPKSKSGGKPKGKPVDQRQDKSVPRVKGDMPPGSYQTR